MNRSKRVNRKDISQFCGKPIKWLVLLLVVGMQLAPVAHAQNTTSDPIVIVENGPGSRYPVKILTLSDNNSNQPDNGHNIVFNNTPLNGKNYWGHATSYDFTVIDNYGKPYNLGDVQESFSNTKLGSVSYFNKSNTPGTPGTWTNGSLFVNGNFTDHNDAAEPYADTGTSTFWFSFNQNFNCINCPGGPYVTQTPYLITAIQSQATRK